MDFVCNICSYTSTYRTQVYRMIYPTVKSFYLPILRKFWNSFSAILQYSTVQYNPSGTLTHKLNKFCIQICTFWFSTMCAKIYCVIDTTESDSAVLITLCSSESSSAVSLTPRNPLERCHGQYGVKRRFVIDTTK